MRTLTRLPIIALFLLSLPAFFSSCQMQTDPTTAPEIIVPEPTPDDTLVGTSWIKGDETLEFNSPAPDGLAVLGSVDHTYTYDNAVKAGNVSAVGDFTLSADEKTLRFAVCAVYPDGAGFTFREEVTDPDTSEETLLATKWLWNGVALEFTTAKKVKLGGVTYTYTYNNVTKTGTIPGVGDFTRNPDTESLSFARYKTYDYGADFRLEGSLAGTQWTWSGTILVFNTVSQAEIPGLGQTYTYSYDKAGRTGAAETLGAFTVNEAFTILTFSDYNRGGGGGGGSVDFKPYRPPAADGEDVPLPTLIGTMWLWDAGGWGVGYLEFLSETEVWSGGAFNRTYTYSSRTKKGNLDGVGPFTVSKDNLSINFVQWKSYPHGAYFERVYERPEITE